MLITNRLARLGSAEGTTTTRKGPGQYTNHSYLLSSALHAPAARLLVHLRDVQSKQDKAITANRTALLVRRKRRDHLVLDSVNDLDFAAPLTVHANYCGTKHRCFSDRGLWLLDAYPASSAAATAGGNMEEQMKFRCKAYNKEDTKFGKPKWIIDLDAAESAFSSYLNTFKVGEVVQYGRNPEVYIVDYPDEFTTRRTSNESARPLVRNKGLRLIQNVITLDKLGLPPIRSIADAFADQMILGSNILDLTETNISYRIDQKQNITFFDVFDSYKKYEHSVRAASGLRQKPLDDPETLLDNVYTNNSEYQSYWSNAASWTVGTESRQVREVSVKESIQRSRGVYRDWKKAAFHGLENTVLVTVLSYDDILDLRATGSQDAAPLSEGVVHGSYSNMLRSYLRSMRDNGLKPLLYFTPSQTELDLDSSTARTNILQVLSNITASNTVESEVEIAYSYPNLLLFSFFSSLTTWAYDLLDTSRASSYKGKVPNVYSFGILMMLVPILEVVSLGHSVIFIDVTVKFHRDPIPYLSTYRAAESSSDRKITTSSNSSSGSGSHSRGLGVYDVAVCKESTKRFLDCNIKSFDYSSADGGSASTGVAGVVDPTGRMAVKDIPSSRSQFRPNFSIMKFAGTEGSMSFLNSWIQDVVAIGDRLGRESYETLTSKAEESFECNYDVAKTYSSSSSASDIPLKGQGQGPIPFDSWHDQKVDTNISAEGPVGKRMLSTYCYLNAVLFTTQEVSTQCYKTKVAPEPSVKPYTGTSAGTEEANRTYVAVLTNSNPSCAAYFEPDGKRKYFSS